MALCYDNNKQIKSMTGLIKYPEKNLIQPIINREVVQQVLLYELPLLRFKLDIEVQKHLNKKRV